MKGEGGWTPTENLALLQLIETEKRFSQVIMTNLQMKIK